jgi:uncharacterized delta-60 repeat protein
MRKIRLTFALALACLAALLPCAAAYGAPADLDRHYGRGGVVEVADPIPAYSQWGIANGAASSDGSVYLLVWGCQPLCQSRDYFLVRYRPDGALDRHFDGGAAPVLAPSTEPYMRTTLVTDSSGRPLVVLAGEGGLRVVRFAADGSPDGSFGTGGEAFVSGWSTEGGVGAATDRRGDIVVVSRKLVGGCCDFETRVQVARFLANGQPDPGFGASGVATRDLPPGVSVEGLFALQPDGSIVATGSTYPEGVSVVRFSPSGVFDDGFGPRIDAAFSGFRGEVKPAFANGLIPRPHGRIDVFGSTELMTGGDGVPQERGFVARLLPSGSPARGFGRGGARLLPWHVFYAVPGGAGTVVGMGQLDFSPVIFRLRRDDHVDRTFDGGLVPGQSFDSGEIGNLLGVDSKGRLLFLDYGAVCVRRYCPPTPHIYRLIGGRSGAHCLGRRATIVGTRRGDVLIGTPHRDVIAALGGSDRVRGRGGNDLICGGRGKDRLNGGRGRDRVRQ